MSVENLGPGYGAHPSTTLEIVVVTATIRQNPGRFIDFQNPNINIGGPRPPGGPVVPQMPFPAEPEYLTAKPPWETLEEVEVKAQKDLSKPEKLWPRLTPRLAAQWANFISLMLWSSPTASPEEDELSEKMVEELKTEYYKELEEGPQPHEGMGDVLYDPLSVGEFPEIDYEDYPLPSPIQPIEIVNPIEEVIVTAPFINSNELGLQEGVWFTPKPGVEYNPAVPYQPVFTNPLPNTPVEVRPGLVIVPGQVVIEDPTDEEITTSPVHAPLEVPQVRPEEVPNPSTRPQTSQKTETAIDRFINKVGQPLHSVDITLSFEPDIRNRPAIKVKVEPYKRDIGEENKKRKDKEKKKKPTVTRRLYRKLLRIVNVTFGTATEILDFITALQDNIYIPKGTLLTDKDGYLRKTATELPMSAYSVDMQRQFVQQVIDRDTHISTVKIDMEGAMTQFAMNQVQDAVIGKISQKYAGALNDMGIIGGIRRHPDISIFEDKLEGL